MSALPPWFLTPADMPIILPAVHTVTGVAGEDDIYFADSLICSPGEHTTN